MKSTSSKILSGFKKPFSRGNEVTSINLFIRGLTLGGKFFFIIFLGKHLTDAQMGEWGIFTTSISLSLYLVGLDFYTYSTRTILDYPIEDRKPFLRDQFVFYLISYALLFPLLYLLFAFKVMEPKLAIFFYIVLLFEHLAQEAYRTFVLFKRPIAANVILFLRTGLWSYVLLTTWFLHFDELKSFKSTLVFWICGGASAVITAIILLSRIHFKSVKGIPVDWGWIRKGIKVSLVYFIATISFKIIEMADRYFLAYYHSKDMVGIYTFYASMANMIEIFVHTTTIIIFSPILIDTFHKNNIEYQSAINRFAKSILIYNIFAVIILAAIMYPVLEFVINKKSYLVHLSSFILLVAAEMVFNVSLIFHYILYVRKNDFAVVKATILTAFTNILLNFILIPDLGINGAALATFLSFIMLVILKAYYTRNLYEGRKIISLRFLRKSKKNQHRPEHLNN